MMRYWLRSICKRVGINAEARQLTIHSLRHSHVALLLARGVSIQAISERLGHTNINTTIQKYSYLMQEFKESESKKIVGILDGFK